MTETTRMNEATQGAMARDESVDDMAERLAKQLYSNREMRKALALDRDAINLRIKQLDGEIDKAERMTKALVPRTRSSKKSEGV